MSIQEEIVHASDSSTHNLSRGVDSPTRFEPPNGMPEPTRGSSDDIPKRGSDIEAPEKKLTLFAFRLALLEKAASGLGTLAFIWATVVLLGGFAIFIGRTDFWVVAVILVSEGVRVFSRSNELEWQHQSTWTLASAGPTILCVYRSSSRFLSRAFRAPFKTTSILEPDHDRDEQIGVDEQIGEDDDEAQKFVKKLMSYQTIRAWHPPEVRLLPGWLFSSKNISKLLSLLQIVSALACIGLSLYRLIVHDYGEVDKEEKHNRRPALKLFYSLALAEAVLFLLEKIYWTWEISFRKLLDCVSEECDIGPDSLVTIRRFFYEAYSRCIKGSIFYGIRMDLVSFSEELLDSTFLDEQLIAVRILQKLVKNSKFSFETLRKLGTNMRVMERLVEMLSWKAIEEQEIREAAAEILSELACKRHSALRVAGIPGAMESISSLLYKGDHYSSYDFSKFNLLGLLILERLARDHDNCFKIGNTRRLLPKVIKFTSDVQIVFQNNVIPDSQLEAIELSLKVVKMLVQTTGSTGKMLREVISNIVYTVSNMRNILQFGGAHIELQRLAIDILRGLAMDKNAREWIASTGGIIRLLFSIFLGPVVEEGRSIRTEAGEAIAMLTLESNKNCCLILKRVDVSKLVVSLDDPHLRLDALRILRNLCAYSGDECKIQLEGVVAAMSFVLKTTYELKERDKLQEATIGLTYQICKLTTTSGRFITKLRQANIQQKDYAEKLVKILKEYAYPSLELPRIRRFVIQQATWMMKHHKRFVKLFNQFGMQELLKSVGDTTSEIECFHVFSGSAGLSQHREHVLVLVDEALKLLSGG